MVGFQILQHLYGGRKTVPDMYGVDPKEIWWLKGGMVVYG